ncbi:MAG: translation initiation factor IF-2 [Phycisphaerae bacterium]|nr:translation initiation factor IF-2 [Phycisphaerae bacterium]
MAEKMRVHLLADELGVPSKAILAKCRAEGLSIRNHMSTLSAGQAATIREWFSEGAHATTVETSERVDLKQVRVKRTRKKAAKKKEEEAAAAETAVAVEVEGEAPVAESAEPTPAETAAPPQAPRKRAAARRKPSAVEAVATEAAAEAEPEVAAAAETQAAPTEEEPPSAGLAPAAVITEPSVEPQAPGEAPATEGGEAEVMTPAAEAPAPPEPVAPAGPQNVPAPAQLQGPRVVRVERPEPLRPVGPRRPPPTRDNDGGPPDLTGPGAARRPRGRGRGAVETPGDAARRASKHRANPRRAVGRGSDAGERLREWRDRDLLEREEKIKAASGRGIHVRRAVEARGGARLVAARKTKVEVSEPILLHEFCAATGVGMQQFTPKLVSEHGILPNRNTVLDPELAQLLASEFGIELTVQKVKSALDRLRETFEQRVRANLQPRPPVVTFLGHVDHGKTSLLDAIRHARVVDGEAGGITQHIGAYRLDKDGRSVTFLDTPGHEAFTAMRVRGANMTDVVVLVVAADDGVMPQTIEAINHAKAAGVPIVVALNKIDLPNADLNRVFGQLAEHQLVPQQWGGEVDVIETSATRKTGIDALIEHLATLADLLELKSDPDAPATGTVIEAEMSEGVGAVARVLVQEGTLREGAILQCGPASGRVRALRDDLGRRVKEAGPSTPVEVAGLDRVPDAGDHFYQVADLQTAKEVAESVVQQRRDQSLATRTQPRTLEDLYLQRERGEIPTLNLILRADMQGSVDVLRKTLSEIPSDEVKLNVLHAAVGGITEGDVVLAEASDALIVGFHVVPEQGAQRLADQKGIEVKLYRVIYHLTDDIRKALEGLLEPEHKEEHRGRAEVREVFGLSKIGKVAGCYVTEGVIARSHYVRVLRDGRIILPTAEDAERGRHRGLTSLRRFKDDASEVRTGFECGLRIEDYDDIQAGDVIEAYQVIDVARTL